MTLNGINRGYFFSIDPNRHSHSIDPSLHKNYVYVIDHGYPLDPFTNPKLCQAFQSSEIIVSEFEDGSQEEGIVVFFQTLPELLQKHLKPEELQRLRQTLEPLLDRFPGLKESQVYKKLKARFQEGKDDATAVTVLALLGILNFFKTKERKLEDLSSQRPLPESTLKQRIQDRAFLLKKTITPFLAKEETLKLSEIFSLALAEPELLRTFLFAFTQPEIMAIFAEENALERGWHDEGQRGVPDMKKEKILRAFFSNANIDFVKLLESPVIQKLGDLVSRPHLSTKIRNFVQSGKRHLFFISSLTFEEWPHFDFPLTQIKIPLKPVGFFWTIRDNEEHESFLMGSMHITAEKLVNFPRKITELFDSSDAMAVEIDITREDVLRRSNEISWEKIQAKELELLSLTEKEEIFQYLKSQHPDIGLDLAQEFDAKTQFLIAALKKEILKSFKAVFIDQKDKTTNQSFCSTGIEHALMKRAKEKNIPIKDLETFDDHFIKFSSGSSSYLPCLSYQELKQIIKRSKWSIDDMVDAYFGREEKTKTRQEGRDELFESLQKHPLQEKTDIIEMGNLDALEVSYLDRDPLSREHLIERNRNMALQIAEFMKSGKKHFCIAGAMHMAGPSSIIADLKNMGYQVDRLIVEEPLDSYIEAVTEEANIKASLAFEDPINPPVVSLEPWRQEGYSYWQTVSSRIAMRVKNILSWPFRVAIDDYKKKS